MKISAVFFLYFFCIQLNQEFIYGSIVPPNKQEKTNTTHGDFETFPLKIGSNAVENSLVCVQAIWRHGPRTQLHTFPNDEYNPITTKTFGDEGLGQLTLGGVITSQSLGKHLRSRYDNFLAKNFTLSEIFVISSETHRTVMTALSVAQGLFPTIVSTNPSENGEVSSPLWYPVPVMTNPQQLDNYILPLRDCKRHDQLNSHYKNSSKINTPDTLELYKHLAVHSGQPIENYDGVNNLYDTIFSVQRDLFKLPVPDWASSVEHQMFNMSRLEYYGFVDSFESMRFVAGPLLYKIVYNFNCTLGIHSTSTDEYCKYTKMYAFSGHDTTISPLLYLFGHYNIDAPPPFNALLLFELHQNGAEHLIRIFYRPKNVKGEEPVELLLKSCGGVPCEFKKFQEIYKEFIIDNATWQKYCDDVALPITDTGSTWIP